MTILIEATAWILSATSLYCVYRQGNGGKAGWALGFINTILWIGYTVATEQFGLVPLTEADKAEGAVSTTFELAVQLFASVRVTVYIPSTNPERVCVVCPPFQL